jgi:hypothetical protein
MADGCLQLIILGEQASCTERPWLSHRSLPTACCRLPEASAPALLPLSAAVVWGTFEKRAVSGGSVAWALGHAAPSWLLKRLPHGPNIAKLLCGVSCEALLVAPMFPTPLFSYYDELLYMDLNT